MNAERFLCYYKKFFSQCTPPPTDKIVSAITESALREFEKICQQLMREENPRDRKENDKIKAMAEKILETKLPQMLGVRGPTPRGSRGRSTKLCREKPADRPDKKEKMYCMICKKMHTKRSCPANRCDACRCWQRNFFRTYRAYLAFAEDCSGAEQEDIVVQSRKIFLALTKKKRPAQGKATRDFIVKNVIPKLQQWWNKNKERGLCRVSASCNTNALGESDNSL